MSSTTFNLEEMDIKLDTEYIGTNFIFYDEVNSTNEELLANEKIREHGTVLLSENQFIGRGRIGRKWISEKNHSLTFSILLTENIKASNINFINLGASLAVAKSLENLYQFDANLKWPNDVLVSNRKVSGILVEAVSRGDIIDRVVIGIGINVNHHGFEGKFLLPPTSVRRELGRTVKRERLLSEILNEFELILEEIDKNPESILESWRSRCHWIGERVRIVDGEKELFGEFEDIDSKGYLILKGKEGTRIIVAGDVSLRK